MKNTNRMYFSKEKILERDAYVCGYCNGYATDVDHIIPWSFCHNSDEDNLISCCHDCNAIAHDKCFDSLAEKRQYIMTVRDGKKWTKKLNNRYSKCTVCGDSFSEGHKGATHFICFKCNKRGYEYNQEYIKSGSWQE